jgi:hypothetical protein
MRLPADKRSRVVVQDPLLRGRGKLERAITAHDTVQRKLDLGIRQLGA